MRENSAPSWEPTQEQISDYLAGRMDDAERESFERRMFEEPDLSLEVERAAELRAALRDRPARPAGAARRWMPLAAAAAAIVLAVGLWITVPVSEVGDTLRGESTDLTPEIVADEDAISVNWQAVVEAANYELRIYREDGSVVYEARLSGDDTAHRISRDALDRGGKLLRVRALDSFRNVRADSGLVRIPGS